jgi:hypothetical protein
MNYINAASKFVSVCAQMAPSLYGNVLFNGFQTQIKSEHRDKLVPITLAHFSPCNTWEEVEEEKGSIIDKITGDRYWKQDLCTLRQKCAAAFAATFPFQTFGLLLNQINRIAKLVSLAHFWHEAPEDITFTARLTEWGKDIMRVVAAPFS